jgi:rfaE bifunctional protein nucleotidyltransferase chain/domain
MGLVVTRSELKEICTRLKREGRRIVFTNGCFDILHRGHVEYLAKAKALGDVLVVGVNSDASTRRLKGNSRPVVEEDDRATVLAALASVDYVCVFDEDTPLTLIQEIVPDVLVKGADWGIDNVVGREVVEAAGGLVKTIEFLPGRSTSALIKKILHQGATQS